MAGFEIKYEKHNPRADDDPDVSEWLPLKDSKALKNGRQIVEFEGIKVPVEVEGESITIFARGVAERDKVMVVLPELGGWIDSEPPPLSNLESLGNVNFDGINGVEVLFIYGESRQLTRAAVVFQD